MNTVNDDTLKNKTHILFLWHDTEGWVELTAGTTMHIETCRWSYPTTASCGLPCPSHETSYVELRHFGAKRSAKTNIGRFDWIRIPPTEEISKLVSCEIQPFLRWSTDTLQYFTIYFKNICFESVGIDDSNYLGYGWYNICFPRFVYNFTFSLHFLILAWSKFCWAINSENLKRCF